MDNIIADNGEALKNANKLEDCEKARIAWANRFGAFNVSQLVAESSVKASKRYTYAHENDETADAVVRSFVNCSIQIEENEENLNLFAKARSDELKNEIKKRNEKKSGTYENEIVRKRIEELQKYAEEAAPKPAKPKELTSKDKIKLIIDDWELRDDGFAFSPKSCRDKV